MTVWKAEKPPLLTWLSGDVVLRSLLADRIRSQVSPYRVHNLTGADDDAELSIGAGPFDKPRLVLWTDPKPTPGALRAIGAMHQRKKVHIVAFAAEPVEGLWAERWADVACKLSTAERLAWTQMRLGGCASLAANHLLSLCPDSRSLAAAITSLRLVTDSVTLADVDELISPDPALDFAESLVALNKAKAFHSALAAGAQPGFSIARIESSLFSLWALAEHRMGAVVRKEPAHRIASATGVPLPAVERLAPLLAHYPRQRLHDRIRALAGADAEIRRGAPPVPVLRCLVAIW